MCAICFRYRIMFIMNLSILSRIKEKLYKRVHYLRVSMTKKEELILLFESLIQQDFFDENVTKDFEI